MIQEKQNFSGDLNTKQSLNGSLNNVVIYVDPITQEKEVTPSKQLQEVVPDKGFTGLSKVIVNPYTPVVAKKKISTNGIYKAADDNLDGYSEVEVATSGVDLNDYLSKILTSGSDSYGSGVANSILKIPNDMKFAYTEAKYMFWGCSNLTEIPLLDTSNVENMASMFSRCSKLTTIPLLNTSNVKNMASMFSRCSKLTTIPLLNTSKVYSMQRMFEYCTSLVSIPLLDTSNVTEMSGMFSSCSNLTSIPLLNTSKARQMQHTFNSCYSLTSIPQLDTSNVTSFYNTFYTCTSLTDVPLLNASKATYMTQVLHGCSKLINFGGFENLGQAYSTAQSANYSPYKLDLQYNTSLTHDSLMNVINNLYDIKTKGCKTQQLLLGSVNLAKLTAEEIAIATEKGWTVS